ncbi:extracellular solute-binding protein [Aureimonas sp. ME7]|uniref:ABC transporter substrate-binding protein n=1 Tax=Aureimonas sp. ME7 TaxID=2744252 RepID=UPI0015FD64E6|nr:extracellular solute-binding protein [Aureimonas sp. ME7]
MTLSTNRRRFLQSGAAIGASLAMPGILRAQEARELVIVSFAGQLQEPHQWLAQRMQERHPGLTIRLVPSESQDVVAQLKAAQGYSPYDAMPNGEPPHLIAIREQYIQRLDPAAVPNVANVVPAFLEKSQGYGVPVSYSLIGIAYNSDLVKTPPKTWQDLWSPEHGGQIGIPRASSNLGLGFLVAAAKAHGGSESDLAPGWTKLQELKPQVGRSPTQLLQMLEREEIVMAPIWNNDAAGAAEKGLPLAFVKPENGPIAVISFMSAIAKTRYPELVNEWMNDLLSPEYQAMAAGAPYFFGPTVQGVAVPEAARAYNPASPEEVAALQTVDWSVIAPQRGAIVEEFDRLFAS